MNTKRQRTRQGQEENISCAYLSAFWLLNLVHEFPFKVFKNTVQQNEDNFAKNVHNPVARYNGHLSSGDRCWHETVFIFMKETHSHFDKVNLY